MRWHNRLRSCPDYLIGVREVKQVEDIDVRQLTAAHDGLIHGPAIFHVIFDNRIFLEEERRDRVNILGGQRQRWPSPAGIQAAADLEDCVANRLHFQSASVRPPEQLDCRDRFRLPYHPVYWRERKRD